VAAETAADPVRDLERKYQQVEKERDRLKQDLATSAALSAVDSSAKSRLPDLLKAMDRFLKGGSRLPSSRPPRDARWPMAGVRADWCGIPIMCRGRGHPLAAQGGCQDVRGC
jgi:hypothetical protein